MLRNSSKSHEFDPLDFSPNVSDKFDETHDHILQELANAIGTSNKANLCDRPAQKINFKLDPLWKRSHSEAGIGKNGSDSTEIDAERGLSDADDKNLRSQNCNGTRQESVNKNLMLGLPRTGRNLCSMEPEREIKKHSRLVQEFSRLSHEQINPLFYRSELDSLFKFLKAWYLNGPDAEERFNRLGPKSRELACLDLRKMCKLPDEAFDPESFKHVRDRFWSQSAIKRKEQKNKIVYKYTLKALQKMFDYNFVSFLMEHSQPKLKKFLRHRQNAFYLYLFRETILGAHVHEDLLMDILSERVTLKRACIERKNNWQSMPKPVTMKKISAAMRYLIMRDGAAKGTILEFMDYANGGGLMVMMQTEIAKKLKIKKRLWQSMLKDCSYRFDDFKNKLAQKMGSKKYKNPWTIRDVKLAIDDCVAELKIPIENAKFIKMKIEFLKIKSKHYSRKDSIDKIDLY